MDFSAFIPILGVVVGWLLSEFSWHYRDRLQTKRTLGKAIIDLLRMREHIQHVNDLSQGAQTYADPESASEVETQRQRLLKKHASRSIVKPSEFRTVVAEIAEVDPLLANNLRRKSEVITHFTKFKLDATANTSEKVYSSLIEVIHDLQETAIDELKDTILEVAWRRSIVTWIRMKLYFADKDKSSLTNWAEHADELRKLALADKEE